MMSQKRHFKVAFLVISLKYFLCRSSVKFSGLELDITLRCLSDKDKEPDILYTLISSGKKVWFLDRTDALGREQKSYWSTCVFYLLRYVILTTKRWCVLDLNVFLCRCVCSTVIVHVCVWICVFVPAVIVCMIVCVGYVRLYSEEVAG